MIDVSKLIPGDKVDIPSNEGIDRVAVVDHTFIYDNKYLAVVVWHNHFGQPFFSVLDGHQIRRVVDAK